MDRLKHYRNVVKKVINKYADYKEKEIDEFDVQIVFDDKNGHYYLMYVGWDGMERIHCCLLHLDIKKDKIWIQKDFVEQGIATDLMELGVPKTSIVLGFQAPYKRPFTEFATA